MSCDDGHDEASIWEQYQAGKSQLPNFSYAGYAFGEEELPIAKSARIFNVAEFGAIANDSISDFRAVQKAIDSAVVSGGGVVLFSEGKYLINEQAGRKKGLVITGDNVVLRGVEGTILFMKEPLTPEDPNKLWTTPAMIDFHSEDNPMVIASELDKDIARGEYELTLTKTDGVSKGDIIRLSTEGTFLNEQFLEGRKTRSIWNKINQSGARFLEYHEVVGVEGNVVKFKAPLTFSLAKNRPLDIHKVDLLQKCGVENIRFEGNFMEDFVHHKNAIHDSGFYGVEMNGTFNSWIANCTFVNVSIGADFKNSLCGTIYNCAITGNNGHSSFGIETGTRCLIAYCRDSAQQWHGPNSSHASVGSVILRFSGTNSGIDLHGDSPRMTLFDDCVIGGFDGESVGKTSHGAHYSNLPNHLNGLVFWNYQQTDFPRANFNFWELLEDAPKQKYGPLTAVNPILVGFKGPTQFNQTGVGYTESIGDAVIPSSLYLAQLIHRGVKTPNYMQKSELRNQ